MDEEAFPTDAGKLRMAEEAFPLPKDAFPPGGEAIPPAKDTIPRIFSPLPAENGQEGRKKLIKREKQQ